MKSAGLSSNYKRMFKKTTKIAAFATRQDNQQAAKEKQKSLLRLRSASAEFERQKKERQLSPAGSPSVSVE